MSFLTINDTECHYQFDDFGHEKTIVFSNSLGTDFTMWDKQVSYLKNYVNILRYNTRGHGKSSTGSEKTYSIEMLGNDLLTLLDHLALKNIIYCGLSMGGQIGQWMGINTGKRFEKIVICNTAAKIGTEEGWNQRIAYVSEHGLSSILDGTADRWFTPPFREKHPDEVQQILQIFASNSLQGYTACCAAVRDGDFREQLGRIEVPVLIISGSKDAVTTVEDGNFMAEQITNSEHFSLPAAHLSNFEFPEAFSKKLIEFINK